MLKGFRNVQYGLTVPSSKKKQNVAKPAALAAFDDDDSDGEHVPKQLARQAASKKSNAKVADMHAAALAEDPSAFDYDGVYDSMVETKAAPVAAARANRSSKYIENLLDKAQQRQKEQDIIYERRQLKERQVEDHLFGDKEKFVTAAYKKKLQEQQLWQEQQRIKDERDEENAAENRGDMDGFSQLTRNVAFGQPSKKAAVKQEPQGAAISEATSPQAGKAASPSASPAAVQPQQPSLQARKDATDVSKSAIDDQSVPGQPGDVTSGPVASIAAAEVAASRAEPESATSASDGARQAPRVSAAKHTDADAASAARERYLARKRKAAGEPPVT